jgi:hypothetical protein
MKKLILFFTLLFISMSAFSQWPYKSKSNDFDGKYKITWEVGSGGEYPYKNASLNIVKYQGSSEVDIYISDAGYSGCNNLFLYFKFNGDENLYASKSVSSGANSDAWFLKALDDIKIFQLLEKFKKHKNLSIRVGSSCGYMDYKFSLKGATKSINYVVGQDYFDEEQERELKRIKIGQDYFDKEQERELKRKKIDAIQDSINKIEKNRIDSIDNKEKLKRYINYKTIMDKYEESKYKFYITPYRKLTFYIGYPIKLYKTYYSKSSSFFVVDKNFNNDDYFKVVYIDKKGSVDYYLPSFINLEEIQRGKVDEFMAKYKN